MTRWRLGLPWHVTVVVMMAALLMLVLLPGGCRERGSGSALIPAPPSLVPEAATSPTGVGDALAIVPPTATPEPEPPSPTATATTMLTPTPTPTTVPASKAVEEGWTLYEKTDNGFGIELPPGWEEVSIDEETANTVFPSQQMKGDPRTAPLLNRVESQMAAEASSSSPSTCRQKLSKPVCRPVPRSWC